MKVAALQMQPAGSIAANLARISEAARSAAAFGARLLVTPEMGVTGYAIWDDIPHLAQGRDGPIIQSIAEISRTYNIAIAAGFPERDGETIYNAVVFSQPDGTCTFYRKCHLFGPLERGAFTPASALSPVIEYAGIKLAMLICYDVEFPEMVRSLALAGAELLLVPTALPRGTPAAHVAQMMLPARAFENHVFIIYADLCGIENGTPYQGASVIAGPDGGIFARAGATETLLLTVIDPENPDYTALDPYLADRRPTLYRL